MLENIIKSFRRTVAVAGLTLGLQGCGDTINNYYFGQDGGSNVVQADSSVQNDGSANDGYISNDASLDGGLADAAPDGNLADAEAPDSGNDASVDAGSDAMPTMLDGSYDAANDGSPDGSSCIQQLYFQDSDEDGYGNIDEFAFFCEGQQPNNYTPVPGDCDDSNASTWLWYPAYSDNDGDSFGSGELTLACVGSSAMSGYSLNNLDCDDENNAIHPLAPDLCDGVDNDCYALSYDGSGEFAPLNSSQEGVCFGSQKSCSNGQWQDNYSSVANYEEGIEVTCDYLDNNCNEAVDDELQQLFYLDSDGDGYGKPSIMTSQCANLFPAQGWVSNSGDCNDNYATINPDAQELCDYIDNNCVNGEDEGFNIEEDCVVGLGECEEEGEYECSEDGLSSICDEEPGSPRYDLCACQDNDCDGEIDCGDLEGKIAFSRWTQSNREIITMNINGCNQINLTSYPAADDSSPAWSPDGSKITFISTRDSGYGIYIINNDGSGLTAKLTNTYWGSKSTWSPDGAKIAFAKYDDSSIVGIYVMNNDGSNVISLTPTNNYLSEYQPAWSPDGTKIAFTKWEDSSEDLYVMDADGNNRTRLTNNTIRDNSPSWSPNESTIAFASDRDGNWEIYVMNQDGSNQTNLTNNPADDQTPEWSPDGTKVVFARCCPGNAIYIINSDGSDERQLTMPKSAYDGEPDWSF